ncbi:hypothetical protein FAIPA1_30092 [Frankia sp. AiPs1]
MLVHSGRLPERPKGAVCKTVGSAYDGSNPSPATTPDPDRIMLRDRPRKHFRGLSP